MYVSSECASLVERMQHVQPTFAYLVSLLREAYPKFAWLHVVEPGIAVLVEREVSEGESNDFLRAIWKGPDSEKNGSVYISAGGYEPESALKAAEEKGDLIAFGRYYISNVGCSLFFSMATGKPHSLRTLS